MNTNASAQDGAEPITAALALPCLLYRGFQSQVSSPTRPQGTRLIWKQAVPAMWVWHLQATPKVTLQACQHQKQRSVEITGDPKRKGLWDTNPEHTLSPPGRVLRAL